MSDSDKLDLLVRREITDHAENVDLKALRDRLDWLENQDPTSTPPDSKTSWQRSSNS
jgi:hypothetical protein